MYGYDLANQRKPATEFKLGREKKLPLTSVVFSTANMTMMIDGRNVNDAVLQNSIVRQMA